MREEAVIDVMEVEAEVEGEGELEGVLGSRMPVGRRKSPSRTGGGSCR